MKVWFQNRRTKFKRTVAEKSDGSIQMDDNEEDELDPCGTISEPPSPSQQLLLRQSDDDSGSLIVDHLSENVDIERPHEDHRSLRLDHQMKPEDLSNSMSMRHCRHSEATASESQQCRKEMFTGSTLQNIYDIRKDPSLQMHSSRSSPDLDASDIKPATTLNDVFSQSKHNHALHMSHHVNRWLVETNQI